MAAVEFSIMEAGIGLIRLNRPEVMNAINGEWIENFHAILDSVRDDRSVRVIIITGAGRGFCGGMDLKAEHDYSVGTQAERAVKSWETQERLALIVEKLTRLRQPVIAAVNGASAGGGFAIALASDIRVAARSASFHVANVRAGISAGECGISWLFPRLVGLSRCFELLVTGRRFDAEEADRIGLLARVVEDDQLMDSALEIARAIAANSRFAVMMSKDVIYANLSAPDIRTAAAIENRTQMVCGSTGDFNEAAAAFREKRKPVFKS
jgi:enoyl-CoA hydratase